MVGVSTIVCLFVASTFVIPCEGCWKVLGRRVLRYAATTDALQKANSTAERSQTLQLAFEEELNEIPRSQTDYRSKLHQLIDELKGLQPDTEGSMSLAIERDMEVWRRSLALIVLEQEPATFPLDYAKKVNAIVRSLTSNSTDEIYEAVYALFASLNKEFQRRIESLIKRMDRKSLQTYLPEVGSHPIVSVIKTVKFDYNQSRYEPMSVLALESDNINLSTLLVFSSDLHELVMHEFIMQIKYGKGTNVESLINQFCQRVVNNNLGCSYYVCQKGAFKEAWDYYQAAQQVIYEWLKILFTINCQQRAATKPEKADCLSGDRDGEIDGEKDVRLKMQKRAFDEALRRNAEAAEACFCPVAEFQSATSNGTAMVCEKCPDETFNLERGAAACTKCPVDLVVSHPSFYQCVNWKLKKLTTLEEMEKKLEKLEKMVQLLEDERTKDATEYIHNGEWIKIQRRAMGRYYTAGKFGNENSKWADYARGFGSPDSYEFWMGLEKIHNYTKTGKWEVIFVSKWSSQESNGFRGYWSFQVYENFSVADEDHDYTLSIGYLKEKSHGPSMNPVSRYGFNNLKFSTSDRNRVPCTVYGAWWHRNDSKHCGYFCFNCRDSNLFDGTFNYHPEESEILIKKVD